METRGKSVVENGSRGKHILTQAHRRSFVLVHGLRVWAGGCAPKDLNNVYCDFMGHCEALGLSRQPKHHLMFHIACRSVGSWGPWLGATFLDESLNKTLKKVLRNVHQATFESSAFCKMRAVLETWARKRKRVD